AVQRLVFLVVSHDGMMPLVQLDLSDSDAVQLPDADLDLAVVHDLDLAVMPAFFERMLAEFVNDDAARRRLDPDRDGDVAIGEGFMHVRRSQGVVALAVEAQRAAEFALGTPFGAGDINFDALLG